MQNIRGGPRKYSRLSEKSVDASLAAIDYFNRVSGIYCKETTLILLSNAWELLAKAVLLKNKKYVACFKKISILYLIGLREQIVYFCTSDIYAVTFKYILVYVSKVQK